LQLCCGAAALSAPQQGAPLATSPKYGDLGNGYYRNPILVAGDVADICAIRADSDYYLVHYYTSAPGHPLWHSRDLVNWESVTRLTPWRGGGGELCQYGSDFFHFKDFAGNRTRVQVRRAPHPAGPWSEPWDLPMDGFDITHMATPDGRRYLVSGSHGANLYEISKDATRILSGPRTIYEGWPIPRDWDIECPCQEGWNLAARDGYYYLTGAQGGTSGPPTSHMVVAARARDMEGPWEQCPFNPVLATRSAQEPFWSQGHARLIDTPGGQWYMFYHAYLKNRWNMGRQIFLAPVEWTPDGWFRIPPGLQLDQPIRKPPGSAVPHGFRLSDDFRGPELDFKWGFAESSAEGRYRFVQEGLALRGAGKDIRDSAPMVMPQTHAEYQVTAELTVPEGMLGGLTIYFSAAAQASVGLRNGRVYEYGRQNPFRDSTPYDGKRIHLRLELRGDIVRRYYSADGRNWQRLLISTEVSGFHRNAFGPAAALRPGLFACGDGEVIVHRFLLTPLG